MKADNFMFDSQGYVKIIDFSIAIVVESEDPAMISPKERVQMKSGTLSSMAPEILYGIGYSYCSDFYSLGCLMFQMLAG